VKKSEIHVHGGWRGGNFVGRALIGARAGCSQIAARYECSCLAAWYRQLFVAAALQPDASNARSFAAPAVDGDMLRIAVERKTEKQQL